MYQAIPSLVAIQRELGGTFVCGRGSTKRYFRKEYPELGFARFSKRLKRFSAGHKAMLSADCIVTGSPYKSLLSPYSARKMMVFHGTYAGLTAQALQGLKHFDHLFLIGDRMERMLLRLLKGEEINYSKTGFIPFCHFPEKTVQNRQAIVEEMGLDPSLKTIVYCPSRRGVGSWDLCAEQLIREISGEYNLVLRPHPSQSMNLRWHEKSSMRAIQLAAKQRGNALVDLVDIALPNLLMVADLFISDSNSPSEEALFYNTPQLLTGLGNSAYEKIEVSLVQRGMPEEDIMEVLQVFDCGTVYSQAGYANWQEAVSDAFLNEANYTENREACFSSIFGQRDRNAGHRVAEILSSEYL